MINRKGQVTLWVVIAIAIVATILLLFFIQRGPVLDSAKEENPESFIQKCVRKHVGDAIDIMLPHGGFIEPENTVLHNNIEVVYLCENIGNYLPCVNQHPMYINEIKEEIRSYVDPRVDECFSDLKREFETRQTEIELGEQNILVALGPDRVNLEVQRKTTISRGGETRVIDNFKVETINPLYDLAIVASEIASQEAKYCYFEYVGYMVLHPRFDIRVSLEEDSIRIYTIGDKKTGKELNIATRSCGLPPGI